MTPPFQSAVIFVEKSHVVIKNIFGFLVSNCEYLPIYLAVYGSDLTGFCAFVV